MLRWFSRQNHQFANQRVRAFAKQPPLRTRTIYILANQRRAKNKDPLLSLRAKAQPLQPARGEVSTLSKTYLFGGSPTPILPFMCPPTYPAMCPPLPRPPWTQTTVVWSLKLKPDRPHWQGRDALSLSLFFWLLGGYSLARLVSLGGADLVSVYIYCI